MTSHLVTNKKSDSSTVSCIGGFSRQNEEPALYPGKVQLISSMLPKFGLTPFNSTIFHFLAGLLMAALWGVFAYRHMQAFLSNGEWGYLVVCLSETLSAIFFIARSAPVTVSKDPMDWFFAFAGTFTPLFLMPSPWGISSAAYSLIIIGTTLQIFGLISLNRSFALVAAKRTIKTSGMYKFVRHPLYASYFIILIGYTLSNTTWFNFLICLLTMGFLGCRLAREEKHLAVDPAYLDYVAKVRYRVIPFVY